MTKDLWQRLLQFMPPHDLFTIVKKAKVTPSGFNQRSITLEKVEKNRPKFVAHILKKVTEVTSSLGYAITKEEHLGHVFDYRSLSKQELLDLVAEGENPFWVVLGLVSSPKTYELGMLIFDSLESEGVFEKYSTDLEENSPLPQQQEMFPNSKDEQNNLSTEQMKQKIASQERKIEKMTTKLSESELDKRELEKRLKETLAQVKELESRATEAQKNLEELQSENEEHIRNLQVKDERLFTETNKRISIEKADRESKSKIATLEQTILSLQKENAELRKQSLKNASQVDRSTNMSSISDLLEAEPSSKMTYNLGETFQDIQKTLRTNLKQQTTTETLEESTPENNTPLIAVVGRNTRMNNNAIKNATFPVKLFTDAELCDLDSDIKIKQLWILRMDVPTDRVRELQIQYQTKCTVIEDLVQLRDMIGQFGRRMMS